MATVVMADPVFAAVVEVEMEVGLVSAAAAASPLSVGEVEVGPVSVAVEAVEVAPVFVGEVVEVAPVFVAAAAVCPTLV